MARFRAQEKEAGIEERICIAGCNGLLGQKLSTVLSRFAPVYGIGRRDASPVRKVLRSYLSLDITDRDGVNEALTEMAPDWIINAAAVTDVDACENNPETARAVNVGGVENLMEAGRTLGARLIHLSTNYVFDGTASPYVEGDDLCPINTYGRTKAEAEGFLQESDPGVCILRTVLLFGSISGARRDFVGMVRAGLAAGKTVRAATDLYCNPTYTDDLAAGIRAVIERDAGGIFHMAGSRGVSRYEFAVKIAETFGLNAGGIEAVTCADLNLPARRPLRAELNTEKAEHRLNLSFHTVEEGLLTMLSERTRTG